MATRKTVRSFGTSLAFNGTSDYMTLPIVPPITGWSIAFWLLIPDLNSSFTRVFSYEDAGNNGTRLIMNTPTARFYTFDAGNGTGFLSANSATGTVRRGEWAHLVFINNGTNNLLYINGQLSNSTPAPYTLPTAMTFTIGGRSNLTAFTKFWMDSFMYQPGVFTQNEINAMYSGAAAPAGVICHLNFNNQVLDQTGNGNNGTLNGTSYSSIVPSQLRLSA